MPAILGSIDILFQPLFCTLDLAMRWCPGISGMLIPGFALLLAPCCAIQCRTAGSTARRRRRRFYEI